MGRFRIRNRLSARSFIFYGLRGVGKTVLLNRLRLDSESKDITCIWIEAPEDRSLPSVLVPPLRAALLKLSLKDQLRDVANSTLRTLASFIASVKIKYADVEASVNLPPEPGTADSGDLEADMSDLLRKVAELASINKSAIIIFVDELQYVPEDQLAALITALHAVSQRQLPLTMVAAGLPQLVGQMGKAKSYAERLFEFAPVGQLDRDAARDALCIPAKERGVEFDAKAIDEILLRTSGYPYFLQEWGKHSWNIADTSPIEGGDASKATIAALAELDASFFRVRLDRLTPSERKYLRAMAELGPGPHRSGDIAEKLNKRVNQVAPVRNSLLAKGMLYSPAHGDTAFTAPLFDGFMKRIQPEWVA